MAHFTGTSKICMNKGARGSSLLVSIPGSKPLDPGSIPGAVILNVSFILVTSSFHLTTMVPACLVGVTKAKVTLNSHLFIITHKRLYLNFIIPKTTPYLTFPNAIALKRACQPTPVSPTHTTKLPEFQKNFCQYSLS